MIKVSETTSSRHVASHYDVLDRWYRELWGEHLHHGYWLTGREDRQQATRQLVELAAARAGVDRGTRVCDVGCGYGATARQLVVQYGAVVTGVTISAAQHRYATQCGDNRNPRVLLRSWLENDFPDASFDALIAIESIQHMKDKARAFAECHRVLRPGGRLVVIDSHSSRRARPWQERMILRPICREYHLPSLCTLGEYTALARDAGFAEVRGEDISSRTWRTWPKAIGHSTRTAITNAELRRFLLDPSNSERALPLTIVRLMAGYATRCYSCGLVTARRDSPRLPPIRSTVWGGEEGTTSRPCI